MMGSERQYIELFQQNRALLAQSPQVIDRLRDTSYEKFCRMGFPTTKAERYRYTNVAESFSPDYGVNLKRVAFPLNPYEIFRCDVPNLSTSLYFVVNDQFYERELPKASLPEGVIVGSLARAAAERPDLISKYYGRQAQSGEDAITALNSMLVQDGLFVYVPKNVVLERPLQIVNVLRADVDLMANRRVLVVLEEGASSQLLVCDHAMDERSFLVTQVVEAFVGENAHLEFYELEETHALCRRFSNMFVRQEANSTGTFDNISLSCGLTRNLADIVLDGENAEVHVNGCVVADGNQHVDNNTLIDHRSPACSSNELYKYVLDGNAVGAFAGRILVRKGAQKTVSQETNANLCATRTARMFTQPMLEIYADDVKCSHGSTVGQLNDAALFYMRQRGIPESEARLLLKFAFVGEVIDSIRLAPLRDRLHYLTEKRFRGELGKCAGCRTNQNCGL